jgi:hypothetical protein
MKKRGQCPHLFLKTQMHLRWSLLSVSRHRRGCLEIVEKELKRAEYHQTKTNPSLVQVLGDSEYSQERTEMFRGRKYAPKAVLKMEVM